MAFEDRIRVVFEAFTDKATAGIKSFRTEVGAAEGFTGKLSGWRFVAQGLVQHRQPNHRS
jgi:hypothetical protein